MNSANDESETGSAAVSAAAVGVTPTDPNKQRARRDAEHSARDARAPREKPLETELLILPDGRILVHNLTQPFAELLRELNPADEQISSRASVKNSKSETRNPERINELPN